MFIRTISNESSSRVVEKKSCFIAYLFKINSEVECKEKLLFLQNKHKDANHIPFAYRIKGESSLIERYSDDGEPSKTAGFPLLKILRQENLLNVVVFVVRFFGGVKLGPAGLMRAFSQSLKLALDEAGIVELELTSNHKLVFDVKKTSLVESFLKKHNVSYFVKPENASLAVFFDLPVSKKYLLDDLSRILNN